MQLNRKLLNCLRLAALLFLVFDVVGGGAPPAAVPAQTAYARMPDPVIPVRATGDTVQVTSGSPQTTQINTAFSQVLVAQVFDSVMQPRSFEPVTFQAPLSGASGTFPGGVTSVVVNADAGGAATSPVFTANGTGGTYPVIASVVGGVTTATFDLTNQAPPTATFTSTPTSTPVPPTNTPTPTSTQIVNTPGTPTATPTMTPTVPSSTPATPTPTSTLVPPSGNKPGDSAVSTAGGQGSPPLVTIQQNANGSVYLQFLAYPITFLGGVHLAMADVNGDGVPDIITAPGPGMQALIRVFDGSNARLMVEFVAFDASFLGGAWVAAGDVEGDGQVQIVVGPGDGGGARIRIFNASNGKFIREISDLTGIAAQGGSGAAPALLTGSLRTRDINSPVGGVRVAVTDADGDGTDEILTGMVVADNTTDDLSTLLPILLLSGNYGGNRSSCRGGGNNNDLLLPLLFLSNGLNVAGGGGDAGVGVDGSDQFSLLPLLQLSGGLGNNDRRCRRRRRIRSRGYDRIAYGAGGYYGAPSGPGLPGYIGYVANNVSGSSSDDGLTPLDSGPGGSYIAAVGPRSTVSNSQAVSRNDEDSARKLTETERRQKERTNRLGLDDDHTEGNVMSVGSDDRGPFAVIANRDGLVTVLLQCGKDCPKVEVGQYLQADGVKENELLFTAEDVSVSSVR